VLLDDVRLALLDAAEAVPDVDPVADVVCSAVEEVELRRVSEPGGDQRGRLRRAFALAQAGRDQRAEPCVVGEARRDRCLVLRSDRIDQPGG
jgi:hypothetical protein